MRIISKFQDYYDSALAFGHDERVVFERKKVEHVVGWKKPLPTGYDFMLPTLSARTVSYGWSRGRRWKDYDTNREGREFTFHPFTVSFCGKLYPGIRVASRKGGFMGEWSSDFAYNFKAYTMLMDKFGLEFTDGKRRGWTLWGGNKGSPRSEEDSKEYFKRAGEDRVAFFAEKGIPIAICESDGYGTGGDTTLLFNSELKKVAFYKVFDTYTTFQELDMFISGVMTREGNPMAGISDTDLRDKKGFNDMSFKKAPTKRR